MRGVPPKGGRAVVNGAANGVSALRASIPTPIGGRAADMRNRQRRRQRLPHFGETENAIDALYGVVNRHPNDRVCFLDDHPGLFGRFIRRERCFGLAVNLEAESPDLGSPVLRERFRGWLFML